MFIISMPKTFKVGDTVDCRINAAPARVTWRDAGTLVIEPDDPRNIISTETDGELTHFFCGDKRVAQSEYEMDSSFFPDGVIVSERRRPR